MPVHVLTGAVPAAVPAILDLFRSPDGTPDALRCAELLVNGRTAAERQVADILEAQGDGGDGHETVARSVVDQVLAWRPVLTGAETVAVLLRAAGVEQVFVYAGTSELALCDSVDRAQGVRVINGRGDKESAFMAAGASLLGANRAAAILHGARGLTNAAGAVADARRNEAGTMFVVGLASTSTARFLPPHGEPDLFGGMGTFADWSWEAPGVPAGDDGARRRGSRRFVAQFRHGLASTAEPPCRPAIFGVPQDVAEERWIPLADLVPVEVREPGAEPDQPAMTGALELLRTAHRPVLLIDDYALRFPGMREALDEVSSAVGAAVLQLRYRRGPMLFERLQADEVRNFVGWLNPFSEAHTDLLSSSDLLITVEDRNIYERVAGRLPTGPKIAINSDPEKVIKNEYLADGDVVMIGDPARMLARLAADLALPAAARPAPWFPATARAGNSATPEPPAAEVVRGRRAVAEAIAGVLAGAARPVLVDDSQMFGGLLSEHYELFPRGLRVFGGHGGFVGGGLSTATGLAISYPDAQVVCTLGDQGFTNSLQGLVAAVEQRARVLFVVCNNGESVSLRKQAAASYGQSGRSYLNNVPGLRYHAVAESLGIPARQVTVPIGAPEADVDAAVADFTVALRQAAKVDGPSLVEVCLPSDPEVWRGIWLTQGFEQLAVATV